MSIRWRFTVYFIFFVFCLVWSIRLSVSYPLIIFGLCVFFYELPFRKELQLMRAEKWAEISIWELSVKQALLFSVIALVYLVHDYLVGIPRPITWLIVYLVFYGSAILFQAVYVRTSRKEKAH